MHLKNGAWVLLGLLGVASVAAGFAYRRRSRAPVPAGSRVATEGALVLHVPRAEGNIVLDGDMDDPGWARSSARTQAFVGADGVTPARPHSEARLVWADGFLYLGLYAADEDIRAKGTEHDAPVPGDDAFHIVFREGQTERVIDINPLGVITDGVRIAGTNGPLDTSWESGLHVSREADGTMNQGEDYDEEWILEMAIPFESLGLRGQKGEAIGFALRRCDTFRRGATSCGSYGEGLPDGTMRGVIVLD